MRALFAAFVLLASIALPAHFHASDSRVSTIDAACGTCLAAHQIVGATPAPLSPAGVPVVTDKPREPDAAIHAHPSAPPRLSRAPPRDPANS
jgi:hypothetical protein